MDGRSKLDVVLQPQAVSGEELVVIGYGTQQKSELTGSVGEEELNKIASSNVIQSLEGQVAGVDCQYYIRPAQWSIKYKN